MDLDNDELRATRKLHGLDEINNVADTNVGGIEKDLQRLNELTKPEHANWIGLSNQKAIANVTEEIKRLKYANEILTNNYEILSHDISLIAESLDMEEGSTIEEISIAVSDSLYDFARYRINSIPKDKIKELISYLKEVADLVRTDHTHESELQASVIENVVKKIEELLKECE